MHFSAFEKARISGFYFFTFPYLFDALFLSRMPALKAQTGATETEIGWVLLTLGLCGLCALLSGNQLLRRVGSRRLCPWSMLAMCRISARTRTLFLWRCGIRSRPCPCCTLFTA